MWSTFCFNITDFERTFDTPKRNLSLESETNIKLPVYGLFVKDLLLRWINKSQGSFYHYFLPLKIKLFQLNSLSNHHLKLIKSNNSLLEWYSFITTSVEPCTCGFTHHLLGFELVLLIWDELWMRNEHEFEIIEWWFFLSEMMMLLKMRKTQERGVELC